MRFVFIDMHSGGHAKLDKQDIEIMASSRDEAVEIFKEVFNRHPFNITCPCCGPDFYCWEDEDEQ